MSKLKKLIEAFTGKQYDVSGGFWESDANYPANLKPHIGTDYPLNMNTPLIIPTYVHITSLTGHADYGNQVWMYDPNRDLTYHLAHLNWLNPELKVGDGRYIGYTIAKSGASGKGYNGSVISNGTVPHLHLGVARGRVTDTNKYTHTWLSAEEILIEGLGAVEPTVPKFKPYNYTLASGSALYNEAGKAYPSPTTRVHKVTIHQEKDGFGLIKEAWLHGVNEAWVKLGKAPTNVGKTAQLRGDVRLYDRNGNAYRDPSGRSRDLKILEEVKDMYKVSDQAFRPNEVYVKKNTVKVV